MSDWTDGYPTDIDYTCGYYAELNPLRARQVFLHAGLVPPALGSHCELGFGQGISANIHAAASAADWHGCDFNPAHAGAAQALAAASGASARFTDEAFADFCARTDLPDFDSIGLHGIWSWVSEANRALIVDLLRRKLKVGGVLYMGYNTLPGWADIAPLRHLLKTHVQRLGGPGQGAAQRVDAGLAFIDRLLATDPAYAKVNPRVAQHVAAWRDMDRRYLTHEYLGQHWTPMHVADVAEALAPAKLDYACSAVHLDQIDPINLSTAQAALLADIADPLLRETARDTMTNRKFRKDYWVKGARRLLPQTQADLLRAQRFTLVQPRAGLSLQLAGNAGRVDLQAEIYNPILDLLADHRVASLAELEQALAPQGVGFAQLRQATMVLVGAGHLSAVQDDATSARARACTDRLNAQLLDRARSDEQVTVLASPVTGGGISVMPCHQLFLLARRQGLRTAADWAGATWQVMQAQGRKIVKSGSVLDTAEGNLAELGAQAETFRDSRLPLLQALQIA